jgi:hypothetical protein
LAAVHGPIRPHNHRITGGRPIVAIATSVAPRSGFLGHVDNVDDPGEHIAPADQQRS